MTSFGRYAASGPTLHTARKAIAKSKPSLAKLLLGW